MKTAEELINMAKQRTGLTDFGSEWSVPHLRVLLSVWHREANLSDQGWASILERVVQLLANRLRLQQCCKDSPEILEQEIVGPVMIIGLPRTGTTKLHRMMSAGGDFHCLPLWQAWQPIPMEGVKETSGPDPRVRAAEDYVDTLLKDAPEQMAMHEVGAHEPEEDVMLMQHSFLHKQLYVDANIPSYLDWVDAQDLSVVYKELRDWLKFLQWQNGGKPKPWLLKAVYHNECLDIVLKEFPDAVLVECHRDPRSVIGSWSNLSSYYRKIYSDDVDKQLIGPSWLSYWSSIMNKSMDLRDQMTPGRILDVGFREICDDIETVITDIYAAAGLSVSEAALDDMRAWEAEHQQHKHGVHHYALEEYGLTPEMVDKAFARYNSKYGLQ